MSSPFEADQLSSRRFAAALSFPGERREYVSQIAAILRPRTSVFYDAFYEAELARPDLDIYLQDIYHNQADLLVVFLCEDYERKEWCGLEWRAIRDLIKKRQHQRIMFMRFDDAEVPGVFTTDGYVDLRKRTAAEAADLICQRLAHIHAALAPTPILGAATIIANAGAHHTLLEYPRLHLAEGASLARLPHPDEGVDLGHPTWSPVIDALPLDAWPRFLLIDGNYQQRCNDLLLSIINDDYEHATSLYWDLLYYTGTRELWTDRAFLSQRLLEMSTQRQDHATSGLILAKGQSWPFLYKGHFRSARTLLQQALESFVRARATSGIGLFNEYMGDISSEEGNVPAANQFYKEASGMLRGADADALELKRLFANAVHEPLGSRHRVEALTRLREDFSRLKSYREGIVQIELAKSFHFLGAPEALLTAEEAYSLLKNEVIMPSSAAKAKTLLQRILKAKKG